MELNVISEEGLLVPVHQRHYCPFGLKDTFCQGPRCMAWVSLLLPDGTISAKGRCGMVRQAVHMSLSTYTPTCSENEP